MNIYLIDTKEALSYTKELKPYGRVVLLDSGDKDISSYKELFSNYEPKIIGLNPGIIEWKFPKEEMTKIMNLKGIASKSSWIFYLDIDYCKKNGIAITNIAGANSQAVAEYAVWMMLSLARKLPLQLQAVCKTTLTEPMLQTEIMGKTMGVVGLGHVGKRVAKIGKGLGMKVTYWSPKSRNIDYDYKKPEDLLTESDFVFNCIELKDETKGFFNKEKLGLLKKDACFISVMGGMGWGTEDDDYIVQMVNQNNLGGFAIENEHEPTYKVPKIKKGKNIFVPAAYAWYTKEAQERSNKMWLEQIIGLATNKAENKAV